jgi:hypothetical protein
MPRRHPPTAASCASAHYNSVRMTGRITTGPISERTPMRNITLSADEDLIAAARTRAREARTTLNEEFRRWLADYANTGQQMQRYDAVMAELRGQLKVGRKLTRDEMNAR